MRAYENHDWLIAQTPEYPIFIERAPLRIYKLDELRPRARGARLYGYEGYASRGHRIIWDVVTGAYTLSTQVVVVLTIASHIQETVTLVDLFHRKSAEWRRVDPDNSAVRPILEACDALEALSR